MTGELASTNEEPQEKHSDHRHGDEAHGDSWQYPCRISAHFPDKYPREEPTENRSDHSEQCRSDTTQ
jgi:hypothetical protein